MPVQIQSQRKKAAKPSITVQEDMGKRAFVCCWERHPSVHLSPLCIFYSFFFDIDKRHRATRVFQFQRDKTRLRPSLVSLLCLLLDGAHRRDDRGLGAAGGGGHRHNRGQGSGGGDDSGLGQGDGDSRVPFAFPLLGLRWREKTGEEREVSAYRGDNKSVYASSKESVGMSYDILCDKPELSADKQVHLKKKKKKTCFPHKCKQTLQPL